MVDGLTREKERIASVETCVPRIIAKVALNYSLFLAGMAASLVAGQSYHQWTPCDGRVWTEAWSEVPFVGHVTEPLSRVLHVPVMLTLFSAVDYGILSWAFRETTEARELLSSWGPDGAAHVMDLGNLPVFSALCREVFREDGVHTLRHLQFVVVGWPHVWIKTTLLTLTWSRATHLERLNIVAALLLTMGSMSWSTLLVNATVNWSYMELNDRPNVFNLQRDAITAAITKFIVPIVCSPCVAILNCWGNREIEDARSCDPASHAR